MSCSTPLGASSKGSISTLTSEMTNHSRHEQALLDILGCPVTVSDAAHLERLMTDVLASRSGERGLHHLVTLNPEYVMLARRRREFRAAVRRAEWSSADGVGIALAARWVSPGGMPVKRVTGVDAMDIVSQVAAAHASGLFLLGGRPGAAEATARALGDGHPGLNIVGTWDGGSPRIVDDGEAMQRITVSGAQVLLVAYGAPGQVEWIERLRGALVDAGVVLAIGVGGAFDFRAGLVRRAPRFFRQAGLEWLFRLVLEPWRWRRQRNLPVFAGRVLISGIQVRLRSRRSPD